VQSGRKWPIIEHLDRRLKEARISMRTIAIVAAALVLGLTAVHAQGPRLAGTYKGMCRYQCCDAQHECAVAHFFIGGDSPWSNTPCNWDNVCAREGQIGWSRGQPSRENSSVTLQNGCWKHWVIKDKWGTTLGSKITEC
jgi:hypothetical protein